MIPIDLKNCTLFLIDGTGTNFIAIRIGEGNFSYSVKRTVEPKKVRGALYSSREGEQEPVDVSFEFVWDEITSLDEDPPTIEEVIFNQVDWTSATPSNYDPDAPFSVNIQIVRSVTCRQPNAVEVTDVETYNFPEFNCQSFDHDIKAATVGCKGYSNRVKPHVTRSQT